MNIYRVNKKGTHWWVFFDLHPKKFGGFKEFVAQDNKKILDKFWIVLKNLITCQFYLCFFC